MWFYIPGMIIDHFEREIYSFNLLSIILMCISFTFLNVVLHFWQLKQLIELFLWNCNLSFGYCQAKIFLTSKHTKSGKQNVNGFLKKKMPRKFLYNSQETNRRPKPATSLGKAFHCVYLTISFLEHLFYRTHMNGC